MDEARRELRSSLREFIDHEVIPAEEEVLSSQESGSAPTALAGLRAAAKESGLWALGRPREIGGGGLPFMDFVYLNVGVTPDTPLERMYREARYVRIYDGPDEVHRMSVARRLLKDPASAPWA